jgi:hypothetical protein
MELTRIEGGRVISRTAPVEPSGRFSFRNLPAGDGYQLVVRGAGLRATGYGQRTLADPWKPINLSQGQHLTDVQVTAQAISRISGKVVDSSGKPLAGARVLAMVPQYIAGRRQLERDHSTQTGLRGDFRFPDLNPGAYYIRVSPQNDSSIEMLFAGPAAYDETPPERRASFSKDPEGYPTVYYPGTSLELAQPIFLDDGERFDDVTITVSKVRSSRVRGKVLDTAGGRPVPSHVMLVPVDASLDSSWSRYWESKDGVFDFRGVLPGEYYLIGITTGRNPPLAGRTRVDIRAGENATSDLAVAPLSDVEGRITIEGAAGEGANLSSISVGLTPSSVGPFDRALPHLNIASLAVGSNAAADGTFAFMSIVPSEYRVVLSPLPRAYVKSIRVDGEESRDHLIRIADSKHRKLEIVLATDTGNLDGRVVDDKGQNAPAARVVLVPESRRRRDLYVAVSSSNTGRFQMAGLAPGRYKVFAWDGPPEGAWTDPDFLKPYEAQGVTVDIGSETSEYVEVKLIP